MRRQFSFSKMMLVASMLLLTAAGCAPAYDLTLNGTGYVPHAGQTVTARVLLASDDSAATEPASATIDANGAFSISFQGALMSGEAYTVVFYTDHDASGTCDAPPTDHSWSVDVPAVSENVVLDEMHNISFVDVCASFP